MTRRTLTPEGLSDGEALEPDTAYDCEKLDKLIRKELPDFLDLDDSGSTQLFLMRYESVVLRVNGDLDLHTNLIEAVLAQKATGQFNEKTRLWAALTYAQETRAIPSSKGVLGYAAFKAVLLQVSGGERLHYTRKTLSALSQKSAGSFDRYLSDFETQSAYVRPSFQEKLELFQGGLNRSLRDRVLARPDGTEWTSWQQFLTVCRRFADAEMRSRELPAKAFEAVVTAASTANDKRKQPAQQLSQRAQKKVRQAAAVAAGASSSQKSGQQATPLNTVINRFCKDQNLCYHCLQPKHTTDMGKGPKGKPHCTRNRVKASDKWGKVLTDAVKAEEASRART